MDWLIPVIGAAIGLGTNEIAVQLVFRYVIPKKEKEIKEEAVRTILELIPKFLSVVLGWAVKASIKNKTMKELQDRIHISITKERILIDLLGGVIGFLVGLVSALW